MSLEDLIKEETGNNFKEKFVHYSKLTTTSIYRAAVDMFRIPTANRLRREAESQRTPKFLEEVIRDSLSGSVQMFMFGSFVLSPYLGLTALTTNLASYIHERKSKDIKKLVYALLHPAKTIYSGVEKLVNLMKNFSITNLLQKLPRKTAKFACIYTLVGTMALGHLFANSALKSEHKYNSNSLNVEVQKISIKKDEKQYQFYLLGEVHLYNYSSSEYARELIEQKNISLLLSEGVDVSAYYDSGAEHVSIKDMLKEQFSTKSWKNISEGLLGISYAIMFLGSDYRYPSPSEICYEKGIPVIFLEKPVIREYGRNEEENSEKKATINFKENKKSESLSTGETFIDGREGISDASYAVLGAIGAIAVLRAPQLYFLVTPARYFPMKNIGKVVPADKLFSGIIDERNELMTIAAFDKISNHQGNCLMRVGLAHVDGIIEEFKKYGEVKVEEVNLEMKGIIT